MDESGNQTTIFIVGVLVVAAVVAYFIFFSRDRTPEVTSSDLNTENIGSEISAGLEESSEILEEALPDTNPFGAEGTNPFDNYKNPFE